MSSSSPELLSGAVAVFVREESGLGFYRRMGVTGGRFPSPGRQCGAGGVRNRGQLASGTCACAMRSQGVPGGKSGPWGSS